MCRLLGLIRTTETPLPAWYHLVGAPKSLRIQAETGCVIDKTDPGHDDSWGIGWFDERGEVSLVRQTGSAADSAYFVFGSETAARGGAGSGPGQTILGHLRKASMGGVTSDNAHPIRADYVRTGSGVATGRPYETLLVAHNGTIRKPLLDTLRADLVDAEREESGADSDTVVLSGWLASRLVGDAMDSTFEVLTAAMREFVTRTEQVARDTADGDLTKVYSCVNLLIAHPTGLYALRQFSEHADYYTLYVRALTPKTDDGATGYVVASEITDEKPGWELLPPSVFTHYAPNGTITAQAL